MTDEYLPELTDEERMAMESCDMTEILGTAEERITICRNAAIRFFRERNEARKAARWCFERVLRARQAAQMIWGDLGHYHFNADDGQLIDPEDLWPWLVEDGRRIEGEDE